MTTPERTWPAWINDVVGALWGAVLALAILWYLHEDWQPSWAAACGFCGLLVRHWVRPTYRTFPYYLRVPLSIGVVALGTLFAAWATLAREPLAYWILRWREAVTLPIIGGVMGLGLASVIYTHRRLEREIESRRHLQEDLKAARSIQQNLLRSRIPDSPWIDAHAVNRASREVGGDYFEIFENADDSICFAVGDVAGKGIPAALLMSTLQSAFLAAHSVHAQLDEVCAHVNRFLYERTTPERYATFFVGHLAADGNLQYVNAGHNPALLVGEGASRRLFGGGLPLGLFPDSEYVVHHEQVSEKDILVVYTDGVTEAANTAEEEFGEERLATTVAAHGAGRASYISAAILEAIASYSGDLTAQADDVTLMILRPTQHAP